MKAAAPKFKGTMLMMNQPGAPIPGAPPGVGGNPPLPAPAAGAPPSGTPSFQAEAAPIGAGAPSAGASASPSRLKGTMVGVAPPKAGAAPAPVPAPAPAPAPATQAMAMPPMGASDHQFGGGQNVNALGSTVAAGEGQFPPGFALPEPNAYGGGAPPGTPAQDFGAPPQDFGAPPPGAGGPYGAPPQQQQDFGGGAYGAPPQDFGAPPQQGQYGAPPQAMHGQQPGMQPPGGYGQMQPYGGGQMMGPGGVPNLMAQTGEGKSWMVTLLLCGFLGYLGVHRFYTGHYLLGGLQLITCGGFGVWAFIDLIFILMGKYTDAQGRPLVKN